jgi:hypothetical protein
MNRYEEKRKEKIERRKKMKERIRKGLTNKDDVERRQDAYKSSGLGRAIMESKGRPLSLYEAAELMSEEDEEEKTTEDVEDGPGNLLGPDAIKEVVHTEEDIK